MKKSPSLNEIDDLNFVMPDLQYSSILHIPFYTRLLHHFYAYFGKINASISAPLFLGYLYYIIIIIQTFLPAFLIDCEDLWPRSSLMSMILYVLGYLYQGPHAAIKTNRVGVSIAVSVVFIIMMIILIVRTEHFHKTGRVSSIEIKFTYYTLKYIMPLFCPHLMAGLPISFDQIVNQNKIDYNLLQIILSILTFGFYLYLFYAVVSPRVLLEDTPSHDWFPFMSFLTIANTTLLAVVSGIAGCVEGKSRVGCSIWIVIQSVLVGLLLFLSNGIIKMIITVVSSATCFSSAFTSIFLTADIFLSNPLSPEILLIISAIAYIVLIVVFKILKQMKMNAKILFFDSFIDAGNFSSEVFDSTYKRPFNFLTDILSVIEFWHPLIINFELFENAVTKWPTNFNILLIYSRLLAIFPDKNQQMMTVATKIANLSKGKIKTPYLYQFRHLVRTRQTSMTPAFQAKVLQINSKTEIINDLLKRFWENILQKNTVNFWPDSDRVFHQVGDLDSLYAQLLDDYPNNYQLLKLYSQFVLKIKHSHTEAKEMNKKLAILKKNGSVKSNFGLEVALQVFPVLNNYVQSVENEQTTIINEDQNNVKTEDNSIEGNNMNDEEINEIKNEQDQTNDETNEQLESAVEELINHSKIGSVWIACAFILVISAAAIVVFYLYYDYFLSKFVNKQEKAINFSLEVDLFCNELNIFLINLNILPLVFENQTKAPISILNRTSFTYELAPELFSLGLIPEFSLSTESMYYLLARLKDRFTKVIETLSLLNKQDPIVQKLNDVFYRDTSSGATVRDMTNNILTLGFDILKLTHPKEFFNKDNLFSSITSNTYLAFQGYTTMVTLTREVTSNYESFIDEMDDLMTLVILLTAVLTLPYLIQLYFIIIQSESIAESFYLFPNTEIRSIINTFGKSSSSTSSKIEEDTTQVASLNNIRRTNRSNGVITVLIFVSSYIAMLVCSLIIYFIAKDFTDNVSLIHEEAYTLTKPFSALSYSFIQIIRFYMLTHDGDKSHIRDLKDNLYSHSGDNLNSILTISFRMLFVAYQQFSTSMWNESGGMNIFNQRNNVSFDYFPEAFIFDDQDVSPVKTFFEELATDIFTESVGHVCDFLWYYLIYGNESLQTHDPANYLDYDFPQMRGVIYWFSNFSNVNRTQIFFKMVEEDVFSKIDKFKLVPKVCFYIGIVWQVISCFVTIMFLIYRGKKIKKALTLYQFIKPEILLQNQKALSLIESGKQIIEESDINNQNAEFIISKISQGMVITDKKLIITSFNESFVRNCQLNDQAITGESLTEIFSDDNQDKSWTSFVQHIEDSIQGKFRTQFTDYFSVVLKNGQACHFSCTAICLTPLGIPNASNISHISEVAFLFDDNTENFMREQLISREKKHLNDMLTNVMPSRIVRSFVNSGECISFIVQSVTIGTIGVRTNKEFDENTADEFIFYKEIFNRFDQEISEFELLTKSNTFSHSYTFVGGLFSEINKPEKHAEESIKFSLKLLSILPELSEKYGVEIHLFIGVHTGGPIVAGVLSFEKPTFQIIGPVGDLANQIKYKGVRDQICITRAVYELIFSASFNVQEQGDTKIRDGKVIPTYLVKP